MMALGNPSRCYFSMGLSVEMPSPGTSTGSPWWWIFLTATYTTQSCYTQTAMHSDTIHWTCFNRLLQYFHKDCGTLTAQCSTQAAEHAALSAPTQTAIHSESSPEVSASLDCCNTQEHNPLVSASHRLQNTQWSVPYPDCRIHSRLWITDCDMASAIQWSAFQQDAIHHNINLWIVLHTECKTRYSLCVDNIFLWHEHFVYTHKLT